MQHLKALLSSSPYMPHGYCFLWKPGLVGLHVISDSLIALSYLSIPFTLGYFVRKHQGSAPFHWMFLCFGVFILACGVTHAMDRVDPLACELLGFRIDQSPDCFCLSRNGYIAGEADSTCRCPSKPCGHWKHRSYDSGNISHSGVAFRS